MAAGVEKLKIGIMKVKEKVARNETESVQLHIELGRYFVRLKRKVPRTWYVELGKLGFNPRVASRYLAVGENWPSVDRTPGSALLGLMSSDLQKLEAVSKLPLNELEEFCKDIKPRNESRGRVIEAVRNRLGLEPSKEDRPPAPEAIRKQLDNFIERLLGSLEQLGEMDRAQLLPDLEAKLAGLPDTIRSVGVEEDEEDDDEEVESTVDEEETVGGLEEADEKTEAVASTRRSSRPAPRTEPSRRTAGNQRGNPQPA